MLLEVKSFLNADFALNLVVTYSADFWENVILHFFFFILVVNKPVRKKFPNKKKKSPLALVLESKTKKTSHMPCYSF